MESCVICELACGQKQGWIVCETEIVVGFLPLDMNAYGHTVIAPKAHYEDIFDIPEGALCEIAAACQLLAQRYRNSIGATGVNLLHASGADAQQSVRHFHVHLLPRFAEDGLEAWPTLPAMDVNKDVLLEKLRIG